MSTYRTSGIILWYIHQLLNTSKRAEPLGFLLLLFPVFSCPGVGPVATTTLFFQFLATLDLDTEGNEDCPAPTFPATFKETLNFFYNTFTASHHREIDHRSMS